MFVMWSVCVFCRFVCMFVVCFSFFVGLYACLWSVCVFCRLVCMLVVRVCFLKLIIVPSWAIRNQFT